jgi:dTMP kinase
MAFIAFEGLDGAGKSTLIQAFARHLQSQDKPYILTREPGGSPLGDEIRELLLRTKGDAPVPRAELLLYQAGRAQHVDKVIRPALDEKKWVLSDRFYASTVAFQNGGRNIPLGPIEWLNDFATDKCSPDLWVLLDLDVPTALSRMQGRELDRFEREAQDFHERVRQSYLSQAKKSAKSWLVLSASDKPEILLEKLLARLTTDGRI